MNQELQFAKNLEELRALAKEQGNFVTDEQVREKFSDLNLPEDKLQMVFDYLAKHKIGIGEPMDLDVFLTEEEKDYLQTYLDEIEELPTYSEGQVEAFTIAAMAGETDAAAKLVEIHLKDVVDIAKLYAGQGAFLEDLIGEGNVALAVGSTMLGSLEKPEEAQGMLGKMIMDAMEEFIKEHVDARKTDQRIEEKVNKVSDKARELAQDLQRKVTVEELSHETGISVKAIQDAIRISGYKIEDIEYAKDSL